MSPEDALAILDQAASLASLTRADHVRVQEATGVLQAAITKPATTDHENTGTP